MAIRRSGKSTLGGTRCQRSRGASVLAAIVVDNSAFLARCLTHEAMRAATGAANQVGDKGGVASLAWKSVFGPALFWPHWTAGGVRPRMQWGLMIWRAALGRPYFVKSLV